MGPRIAAILASIVAWVLVLVAPAHATFPGANGKIAFQSGRSSGPGVYTMNPDGSGQIWLAPSSEQPAWSADGARLLFSNDDRASLSIANADGTNVHDVCTECFFSAPGGLAWSPDGGTIAYADFIILSEPPTENGELFTIRADGSNLTRLTNTFDDSEVWPDWSPDGSTIAFQKNFRIATIKPDGTSEVVFPSSAASGQPSWSPDGRRIAFSAFGAAGADIFVTNADGTNPVQLTSSVGNDLSPAWSPDGTKIAFASDRDGNLEIYVMNADGGGQTRLTNDPAADYFPDWQPLPGPRRENYRNAAQFCKAERAFLGDAAFARKYSLKGNPGNAFGKCVSRNH